MLIPDLFNFAYIPNWYEQLDALAALALPESWRFKKPLPAIKNITTPILERYIQTIFKKVVIDYSSEPDPGIKNLIFYLSNKEACFNIGLLTRQYKPIYGYFIRNKREASMQDWYFQGFCDDAHENLKRIEPLPVKLNYQMPRYGLTYSPDWYIRVNVAHILSDPANLERIPKGLREMKNLPLLLETAVELARRKSAIDPNVIVPQGYQQRVQYLLPVCLTDMEHPDLAMALSVMDGYYLGSACLTLETAYLNARLVARPSASWLLDLLG